MAELVKVTINGEVYEVEKGRLLIDVCREKGHAVPSFCYYADLALQASCRMCLVRIEKMPKLQTSCTVTVTDGMVVTTESEEIEKARRGMLEFLLANHPLDCPVCDRGGECELQELTFDWGNLEERFIEPKNYQPERYLSPMVANDPQRCILCKRCTRVCDEWMGEEAIEAGGRGAATIISAYGDWLNCSQCGNCIEVCPTGTLLDATYRHQARPWELVRTISTCTFCSDGCQLALGARGEEVLRTVARDRYVNGINGEFLCVKGRFASHPFVNHQARLRTPMIRYRKGGKLLPATWDQAVEFVAQRLSAIRDAHGPEAIGVVGSPRLTNEANYTLLRFARDVIGTENYTATDAFSLVPFFENMSAPLATHRDIRDAQTILLIGGEPEELQPLTGKQIRQAVRNGGARLIVVNSVPIRLTKNAAQFIHSRPGAEEAFVLALVARDETELAARKMGVEASEIERARRALGETQGTVVIAFGQLSPAAQKAVAQLPHLYAGDGRRFLFHPLPLFNNSVGVHDMGLMRGAMTATEMLDAAGEPIRALYVAGSFLRQQLDGRAEKLGRLDLLVVQELFETETTKHADVVLPAASFAEVDGTFTNNAGQVQRVRQAIPPVHLSKPDWLIVASVAEAMGAKFGIELSASAIFRDIAANVPAYQGLRYPLLKDESRPVQVKHALAERRDIGSEIEALHAAVAQMDEAAPKITETPPVGHELFKLGTLTEKLPQFHYLAAGNPKPENTLASSPLIQLTIDAALRKRREEMAVAGD